MGNMLDYLDWRGDLTFAQSPFNEVDNLILSQLVYLNFDYVVPPKFSDASITIRDAAELYFARYKDVDIGSHGYMVRTSASLLQKLANTARFADAKLSNFQDTIEVDQTKQFSAMHVELTDGTVYIAYRGTDTSIVGWKENFNMMYLAPVPAQVEAVHYLEDTALEDDRLYRLGGHSKGGNLAVYAAVMCHPDLKRRILEVYNNDGPGFDAKFVASLNYANMRERIRTIVPQSSIVGLLLEHEEEYVVVKSHQPLLMQHDALSWEVLGDRFVRAEQVTEESRLVEAALKSWLKQLNRQERQQFVEALFQVFQAADVWTVEDLSRAKWRKVTQLIRALNRSHEHKVVIARSLKMLFHEGRKVFISSRKTIED